MSSLAIFNFMMPRGNKDQTKTTCANVSKGFTLGISLAIDLAEMLLNFGAKMIF